GSVAGFAATTGLPLHAQTLAVPGAFDFASAGVLAIPDIGADGSDAAAHTQAVITHLATLISADEGTLVLLSSRRQMETVAAGLDAALRRLVLAPGDDAHAEIVPRPKELTDGVGSRVTSGTAA